MGFADEEELIAEPSTKVLEWAMWVLIQYIAAMILVFVFVGVPVPLVSRTGAPVAAETANRIG